MRSTPAVPFLRPLLGAVLVLAPLIAADPAMAQTHTWGLAATGGWSRPSDLTPGFASETVLEPGWTAGLQLERWFIGRLGLRANGSVASRDDGNGEQHAVVGADLSVLTRLLPPRHSRAVSPYVSLGLGAVAFRSSTDGEPIGGGLYGPDPIVRGVAVAGFGADLLASSRFGLRLEVSDQMVLLSTGESPASTGLPTSHTLQVTTGIQLRLGGSRRTPSVAPVGPAVPRRGPAMGKNASPQTPPARVERQPEPAEQALRPEPRSPEAVEGFTVEVGSLVDEGTAEAWVQRLSAHGVPAWSNVVSIGGQQFRRVRVGLTGSEDEARELADALARQYGWSASPDRINDQDRPPADARHRTRAFLAP